MQANASAFSATRSIGTMSSMLSPSEPGYTIEQYFRLVETGALGPDDRVELLEGVIVAVSPQNPRHASAVRRIQRTLHSGLAHRAVISVQLPLVAAPISAPEPDVAVLPGTEADYDRAHPTAALLVVEVAERSIAQDRLTKAAIYAAAGIPEYWIVNLRDQCVEVFREPDTAGRSYRWQRRAERHEILDLVAFPDVRVSAYDLFPSE